MPSVPPELLVKRSMIGRQYPHQVKGEAIQLASRRKVMKREIIRVEPLSTYLERWKAPTSAVTRYGDTIYVSGFPPFDPAIGEVIDPARLSSASWPDHTRHPRASRTEDRRATPRGDRGGVTSWRTS
jgi:hypothetical protein